MEKLFALNDLRQLADHRTRTGRREKLNNALRIFGLNPAEYAAGWGLALDAVYDGVVETLEVASNTLIQTA